MTKSPVPAFALARQVRFKDRVVPVFENRPKSVWELVAAATARRGDGEALICGGARMTWNEVAHASRCIAASMDAMGIRRGDRIALQLGNRNEFVLAWFAASHLGAITVPLSTRHLRAEIAYAINNSGARLFIHEAALADRVPDAAETPDLAWRISAGGTPGPATFESLLTAQSRPEPAATDEEDTNLILYTSGTTGQPKGAMLAHCNIIHSAMVYESCMGLTEADRSIAAVPLAHVTGIIANIASMARCAGALIIVPEFKAADFLAVAERERVTQTIMVPAMYNLCLLQSDFDRFDLSAWRIGGYGGAPMPIATIERLAAKLPNLELSNVYGATETTSPCTFLPAALSKTHLDSVGLPCPGTDILIMDEDGRELPHGEIGEVWIHGGEVVKGYWNNAKATEESFVAGYWRSGDLGTIDSENFVRILDRKKDMINRGGLKIYSAEVESVLASHPDVLESAVIGEPCPVLGERVCAVIVPRRPDLEVYELRAWCSKLLADYKVPETITLSDTPLPRNANGKVLKRQLREQRAAV